MEHLASFHCFAGALPKNQRDIWVLRRWRRERRNGWNFTNKQNDFSSLILNKKVKSFCLFLNFRPFLLSLRKLDVYWRQCATNFCDGYRNIIEDKLPLPRTQWSLHDGCFGARLRWSVANSWLLKRWDPIFIDYL